MNVAGLGIVCARGRGMDALEQALIGGWMPPARRTVPGLDQPLPVYAVPDAALDDRTALAKARRADRLTRLALLATVDAWRDSGLSGTVAADRVGVVLATGLGPHATTFGFLDGILDFGDAAASPTTFSHSVHNAATSYLAMALDVRGPTLTVTHFHFAFHEAVRAAGAWLSEKRCEAVLVTAVDELSTVLEHVCGRLATPAADGRIRPFACAVSPGVVPGEGSVSLVLTRGPGPAPYGRIAIADGGTLPAPATGATMHLLDACGLAADESAYRRVAPVGMRVASYTPLFGSTMIASAFHAAVAAWMLKRQMQYACPVPDNPHGLLVCDRTEQTAVDEVRGTQLDCTGTGRSFRLVRTEAAGPQPQER